MAATAWKTQGAYQPSGIKDLFSGGESDWKFDSSSCGTTKAFYDKLMHSEHKHTASLPADRSLSCLLKLNIQ